ncbi:MAG: serine hydroxymethyltransferase [Gemmobacter sp.]|uniref:serine hydroxymethyltransferase n=1 Tax=Gemmobacter sp. TaxID=1898957 RepID=UPI003918B2B1
MTLAPWMSPAACARLAETAALAEGAAADVAARLRDAAARNRSIHDAQCFNLDPAANAMTPAAEAMLAAGLGSRPSLGWPGEKYETGLEAIEEIEGIATALAAQVFRARHAEIRVGSGALANLYAFMALAQPGDAIIAPPPAIGGHVTHHAAGCAGLYGLRTHPAPVDADGYTVDLGALEALARRVKPKVITIGGSLNLFPHPVAGIRAIADSVGAAVLFDAAHQCGLIAGGVWPDPLAQGAHVMTMSTYKSLGGPAGGLIVTNDTPLAARLNRIAFPGMTANSDAGRAGALAMTLLDWREHGQDHAAMMVANARALAAALQAEGVQVFAADRGATQSHQFALLAAPFGGGQAAAKRLYAAGFIACGIGLPLPPVEGDTNGLRLGTPEITRRGMTPAEMPALAALIARALRADDPARVAPDTRALRARFQGFAFTAT